MVSGGSAKAENPFTFIMINVKSFYGPPRLLAYPAAAGLGARARRLAGGGAARGQDDPGAVIAGGGLPLRELRFSSRRAIGGRPRVFPPTGQTAYRHFRRDSSTPR